MEWLDNLLGLNAEDLEWYQMVTRGIIIYFIAMFYIRIAGMRSFGTSSAFDVVITITMGAVLSRAISGHYPLFSCLLTAFALALCHRGIAFLSYRSKRIRQITEGMPVPLYDDGVLVRDNLSKHSIHEADLNRVLREQGMDNYHKVKSMWYEVDGKISVVVKD